MGKKLFEKHDKIEKMMSARSLISADDALYITNNLHDIYIEKSKEYSKLRRKLISISLLTFSFCGLYIFSDIIPFYPPIGNIIFLIGLLQFPILISTDFLTLFFLKIKKENRDIAKKINELRFEDVQIENIKNYRVLENNEIIDIDEKLKEHFHINSSVYKKWIEWLTQREYLRYKDKILIDDIIHTLKAEDSININNDNVSIEDESDPVQKIINGFNLEQQNVQTNNDYNKDNISILNSKD